MPTCPGESEINMVIKQEIRKNSQISAKIVKK